MGDTLGRLACALGWLGADLLSTVDRQGRTTASWDVHFIQELGTQRLSVLNSAITGTGWSACTSVFALW